LESLENNLAFLLKMMVVVVITILSRVLDNVKQGFIDIKEDKPGVWKPFIEGSHLGGEL
jgi:hypothetical protein